VDDDDEEEGSEDEDEEEEEEEEEEERPRRRGQASRRMPSERRPPVPATAACRTTVSSPSPCWCCIWHTLATHPTQQQTTARHAQDSTRALAHVGALDGWGWVRTPLSAATSLARLAEEEEEASAVLAFPSALPLPAPRLLIFRKTKKLKSKSIKNQ
jgi:FtsZ-interacting cell division protein ZipA